MRGDEIRWPVKCSKCGHATEKQMVEIADTAHYEIIVETCVRAEQGIIRTVILCPKCTHPLIMRIDAMGYREPMYDVEGQEWRI